MACIGCTVKIFTGKLSSLYIAVGHEDQYSAYSSFDKALRGLSKLVLHVFGPSMMAHISIQINVHM